MSSHTIDLIPNIKPTHYKSLLQLDFRYGANRKQAAYVHQLYKRQKKLAAEHLQQWFRQSNQRLVKQVGQFVATTMDMDDECCFPVANSNMVNGASLVLGMHSSDHKATIDLVEEHLRDNYEELQIFRVGSDYVKRSQFIDLICEIRDYSNVLIIIEQLESINRFLLKTFVTILHDLLNETELERAMILFCMSTGWQQVGSILPIGAINRLKMRDTIIKDNRDDFSAVIQEKLLTIDEYDTRIGPNILQSIYDAVQERDTSIAHLSYLFQYCLLVHNLAPKAIFKLPKKQLTEVLTSRPELTSSLKALESLAHTSLINSNSTPNELANFCTQSMQELKSYFKFLWSQIHCYFVLLRDETENVFPFNVFHIYAEITSNQNLADSSKMIDAIIEFSKYPTDGLLKRIDLCCSEVAGLNGSLDKKDIRHKLVALREKIVNNDDDQGIRKKLREELFKHSATLINPRKFPMSEVLYFNPKSILRRRLPTSRYDAANSFIDKTSCYGLLYGMIHNGPEEMSLTDLCEDFAIIVDENKIFKSSPKQKKYTPPNLKTTPRRRDRTSNQLKTSLVTKSAFTPSDDIAIKKTIFSDLISSMHYQGLINQDTRQSKRGIIRRCVWL